MLTMATHAGNRTTPGRSPPASRSFVLAYGCGRSTWTPPPLPARPATKTNQHNSGAYGAARPSALDSRHSFRDADRRAPASTRRRPIGEIEHSVAQFHAFGPPAGAALNITLFSYDGAVTLGITTDEAAVTDRELFLRCLDQAIAEMLELAERAAAQTA
jgi:hypothetical protein